MNWYTEHDARVVKLTRKLEQDINNMVLTNTPYEIMLDSVAPQDRELFTRLCRQYKIPGAPGVPAWADMPTAPVCV